MSERADPIFEVVDLAARALAVHVEAARQYDEAEARPDQGVRLEAADRRCQEAAELLGKAEAVVILTEPETTAGTAALLDFMASLVERGIPLGPSKDAARALRSAAFFLTHREH